MNLRLAQVLAVIGVSLAVVSVRWAWVLSVHPPHLLNTMTWTTPVLVGLLATVVLGWSVWLFHAHPRVGAPVNEAGPRRWPLHRLDCFYSILCCAVGGMAALLFVMKVTETASWLFAGPPLLFDHLVVPFRGWQSGPAREFFTIFAFVLYYHLLAAPGYALLTRTESAEDETRNGLLIAQRSFAAVHFMLVALFAWLMQA